MPQQQLDYQSPSKAVADSTSDAYPFYAVMTIVAALLQFVWIPVAFVVMLAPGGLSVNKSTAPIGFAFVYWPLILAWVGVYLTSRYKGKRPPSTADMVGRLLVGVETAFAVFFALAAVLR